MPPPRRGPAAGTMSPVLGRPPRAPRSRPVNPGATAPETGKCTTAMGQLTGGPRATRLDEAGRTSGAKRHARKAHRGPQPWQMNRCQATTATGCRKPGQHIQHATNHGTRTGARQHQPPSRWTCARLAANRAPAGCGTAAFRMDQRAPGSIPSPCRLRNSCRMHGRVRVSTVPSHCRLRQAAVQMDESGSRSDARHTQHSTPSARTSDRSQVAQGTPHATHSATHRASTPQNPSQEAEDAAQAERAHQ